MADNIYALTTTVNENFDGYEDINELTFYPYEEISFIVKNTKVVVVNVVTSTGLHLDRTDLSGMLDNPLRGLDSQPEDTGEGSVLCPNDTLVETFDITDDVNTTLTTAEVTTNLVTFDNLEILVSDFIVKDNNRYLKRVTIQYDNSNLDAYIDYGSGFIDASSGEVTIPASTSNSAIYKLENTSGSQQELSRVTCVYEFW